MWLLLFACSPEPVQIAKDDGREDAEPEIVGDGSGEEWDWFAPDHVIEVSFTMNAADWSTLRYQTRSVYELLTGDCLAQPFESPFTWFPTEVTIDGETRTDAQVRKKGLIGSMSSTRPSLKIDLADEDLHGTAHFTLNGTPQDPTMLRTCLAYEVYASAGVPAPRCSFAHVSVNGEDLGIYANVETLDNKFVDRTFGGHDGELFEGSLSDLREGWLGSFDPDTDNADTAHLQPLVDALAGPDAGLYDRLDGLVDLEEFHTFWASEVLIGQWDGYTSNTNNFYVYLAPDGKVRFIPWGPDGAFSSLTPFGAGSPSWAVANAQLPWRLIQIEDGEAAHREHLETLLSTAWDGDALVDEVVRMEDLLAPYWTINRQDLSRLEGVVNGTEAALRASLADDPPTWPDALTAPPCLVAMGTIRSAFQTSWDSWATEDASSYGDADMSLVWDGSSIPAEGGTCIAGDDGTGYAGVLPILTVGDATIIPYLSLSPTALAAGEIAIDGHSSSATLYYADPSTSGNFVAAAYIGGTVTFSSAGAGAGDIIAGEIEGTVYVPGG